MEIKFTGRHQEVSATVKSYLIRKLERSVENIPKVNGVNVILDSERFRHKVEVVILLNHMRIRAEEKSDDILASIDQVMDKVTRQLKKYKDKLQYHRIRGKEISQAQGASGDESEALPRKPRLVRVKGMAAKPMDPQEAMMQLALSGEPFLVFVNSETECVNVIYKMKNEDFGLIEPRSLSGK